jgi:2-polyprenyl-6-methoxyphenol hydroxylase-like FAD-dependent oxidoreductase
MTHVVVSFTRHPGRGYQAIANAVYELSTRFAHTDESEYRFFTSFSESYVEMILLSALDENDELRIYFEPRARTFNADPEWRKGAQSFPELRLKANSNLRQRLQIGRSIYAALRLRAG